MKPLTFLVSLIAFCLQLACGSTTEPTPEPLCVLDPEDELAARAMALLEADDQGGLRYLLDSLEENGEPNEKGEVEYAIGKLFSRRKDVDRKYQYYKRALKDFRRAKPLILQRVAQLSINVANAYLGYPDKLDSLVLVSRQAIKTLLPYTGCPEADDRLVELYHMAGVGLRQLGDYDAAEFYLTAGANSCTDTSRTYWRCGRLLTELARTQKDLGQYPAAKNNLARAEKLFLDQDSEYDYAYVADNFDARADLARLLEDPAELLEAARGSIRYNRRSRPESAFMGHSYNNLGLAYALHADYQRAETLLDSAMLRYRQAGARMDYGTCFENYAAIALAKGDSLQALAFMDSAAIAYHGDAARPALVDAIDRKELQDPLIDRARLTLRLHLSRPLTFPLTEVKRQIARVDTVVSLLQYGVGSEASKRKNIERLRTFYEEVVTFGYERWRATQQQEYLDFSQVFLERSKSRILRERRRSTFAGLDEDGGKANDALFAVRSLQAGLRAQLRQAPENRRESLRRALRRITVELQNREDAAAKLAPNNFLHARQSPDIVSLVATLPGNEIITDYLVGNEAVYLSYAGAKVRGMLRLSIPSDSLSRLIEQLQESLIARGSLRWDNDPEFVSTHLRAYREAGVSLYRHLLAPLRLAIPEATRLTVIPDGPIHNLPFGALLTAPPTDTTELGLAGWPFALRDLQFNYEFSTGLWLDRNRRTYDGGQQMLIVNPVQTVRQKVWIDGFTDSLPLARLSNEEVNSIEEEMDVWVMRGGQSAQLRNQTDFSPFGILHFTGHGIADPRRPANSVLLLDLPAAGVPVVLRLPELEALPLNVQLLVLSACQTGVGELAVEEGVISLGRAGAIAGARSVITSLWDVNQAGKALLFADFYRALAAGALRAEALRSAQLHVLGGGDFYSHPYYWSAFLHTGDNSRLAHFFS